MFELNEKVIKKYTTPIIFHRGTNIYLQNNVTVIRQEDQDSDMKNIEGNVNSFEEKKSLKVKVNIDFIKENMSFDCECSDFKNSEKQKACKHIVALYLRFIKGEPKVVQIAFSFNNSIEADTNTERISLKNNQEADAIKAEVIHKGASNSADEKLVKDKSLIKEKKAISNEAVLSKNKLKTTLRKALNVKVQLIHLFYKKEKSTSMEIEMGESKTYKIEDIRGFLLALKRKGNYYVNDSFTFNPEKHSFKKEDISLIKIIAARNKLGNEKYAGKTVYLDSKEINDALQVLKLKNFDLVLEDKQYENIKIIKQDIPLEFEIKQETEKVILKQLNEMPVALNEDKDVFFFRGSIFIPSAMQAYRYLPFYEEFMSLEKTEKVYIDKDIERACSLLEFKLKDISEKIKVIKPEKNKMPVFPLKARVEIVTSSKGLLARPFFGYGEIEIAPSSSLKYLNASKVAKRDIVRERKIIDSIKALGFFHTRDGFLLSYEDKNSMVKFVKNGIKELKEYAEVYCDQEVTEIKIYEAEEYSPKIDFYNTHMEFNLGIEEINYRDIVNIFEAVKDYDDYYRLDNGNFISLKNKELEKLSEIIGERRIETNSLLAGNYTVSRAVSVITGKVYERKITSEEEFLRKQMENEKIYADKNEKLKELLLNMEGEDTEAFVIPPELNGIMRQYQKTGYKWFKALANQGLGGILADEMGLGKTLQAIALILAYAEEEKDNRKPAIVVAPTSLIYNWENEIEKFAPELKNVVIYGTQKERKSLRETVSDIDIIITSYSLIGRDIDEYASMDFSYVFIDEAQQIKNPRTMAAKAVKMIKADAKFALTGTPIENSLMELWSIFDFIMPGYLLSYRNFKEHYEVPIVSYSDKKALESLNNIIRPFILRRLKKEVLYELPEKIEQRLIVEMTDEQKEAYSSCLKYSKQSIYEEINTRGFSNTHIHILAALTKLRQVCCHPAIVMPDYLGESGKLQVLENIVEESISNNHRILIFSQFISALQMIYARLKGNNIKCLYLDGSTKTKDRLKLVEDFNSGKAEVFLISLKAGGLGLNLTGADVVIHFDPWWNPAVEEQATDRAHRIGQTKNVEVIKLVTKGTIEEKILKLHDKKKFIANSVISNKNNQDNFITSLSREDLEDLFRV